MLHGDRPASPGRARLPRSSAAPAAASPLCSTWSPGCSTSPAARCSSTASTCATSTRPAVGAHRARAAEAVPVHRHGRDEPALRPSPTPPTRSCGTRSRSPRRATSSRRCRRARCPDRAGRHNVSGGQRQRLAIARALVRRAGDLPLRRLVLGARLRHRRALRAALARETADATVVIVAQRVSTIRDADRIVVLDEGGWSARGTHAELMDATRPTARSCSPSSPRRRPRHETRPAAAPERRPGPARGGPGPMDG